MKMINLNKISKIPRHEYNSNELYWYILYNKLCIQFDIVVCISISVVRPYRSINLDIGYHNPVSLGPLAYVGT